MKQEEKKAKLNQLQDEYLIKKANKRYSTYGGKFFTVFRVGERFKHNPYEEKFIIDGIDGIEKHNLRKVNLPNVDKSKCHLNRILIGSENLKEDIYAYLEGVKIYKNSTIAREVILSAGYGFWDSMLPQDREIWLQQNIKFLKHNFGDNCVHAILHLDELNPHIHCYIVALDYSYGKIPHLNSSMYFDGKDKLSLWQDKYTDCMRERFNFFIRGIKGSKATHIDLKTYYALVKEDLNLLSSESILAHAKENFISQKKIQELQETLNNKIEIEKLTRDLTKRNNELSEENKLFEFLIKELSDRYRIPKHEVVKILQSKDKYIHHGYQRER